MTTQPRRTPLHEAHVRLGARMVPFAGWEMPVQYQSVLAETRAVRTGSGIFDISHMGRIMVEGPDAAPLLEWTHTAKVDGMSTGRARYGLLCNEDGGIIDDGIVYRLGQEQYLLVANAANTGQVLAWLRRWGEERFGDASIRDDTDATAMVAFQGPSAVETLVRLSEGYDPAELRPFRHVEATVQGHEALIARTGYTGEDGVELMLPAGEAPWLWGLLLEQGAVSCGLGARDILRLEAGLLLHGADMDGAINPVEAGLERFVGKEDGFCGAAAIREARASGGEKWRLVGFKTLARGAVPRSGSPLLAAAKVVGHVTSGAYSPTLDTNIGLGYVPVQLASAGARLQADVRGKLNNVVVVPLPFYSRPR